MAAGYWLLFRQNTLFYMLGIYCQEGNGKVFENWKDFDLLDPFWKERFVVRIYSFCQIVHTTIANLHVVFIKYIVRSNCKTDHFYRKYFHCKS